MRGVFLAGFVILAFFLIINYASAPTGFCGDGICEYAEKTLTSVGSSSFQLYGETHTIEFIGFSPETESAYIELDGVPKGLGVNEWKTVSGVPVKHVSSTYSTGETPVYIAIGEDPTIAYFGSGQVMIYNGISLSPDGNFIIGDNLNKFIFELTITDLPVILSPSQVVDKNATTYPYSQHIFLGSRPIQGTQSDPYLYIGTNPYDFVYLSAANFSNPVDFSSPAVQDEEILLFGNYYMIGESSTNNAIELIKTTGTTTVSLSDLNTQETVEVGVETFTIELTGWNTEGTQAYVKVNGNSYSWSEYGTYTISGVKFYVKSVIVFYTGQDDQHCNVDILVGKEDLYLQDGLEAMVNGVYAGGTRVSIGSDSSGVTYISIRMAVAAGDVEMSYLDTYEVFEDPVWGSFKLTIGSPGMYLEDAEVTLKLGEFYESCSDDCYECTDSDGGENFYEKGVVYSEGVTEEDFCTLRQPEEYADDNGFIRYKGAGETIVNTCYWSDCHLVENFCREIDNARSNRGVVCPGGCSDGQCMGYTQQEDCVDTDGGKNLFEKGVVYYKENGQVIGYVDTCRSGAGAYYAADGIMEYTCESGTYQSSYLTCPNGCLDGACIQEESFVIKGRLVDKYSGAPLEGVMISHLDNSVEWEVLETQTTGSDGSFEFVDSTYSTGYILDFMQDCYNPAGIVGEENPQTDGYEFYLYDTSEYCNEQKHPIINGVVDLGDVRLQPAVDLEFYSHVPVSYNVYQKSKYCDYDIGGAGFGGSTVEDYSPDILLMDYENRIILNEFSDNPIYSDYHYVPIYEGRCYKVIVSYLGDGTFQWSNPIPVTGCSNGICEAGETWVNCPQDCETPTCPYRIDLKFNKYEYYPGDYFEYTVKIYDDYGNPMPNQGFNLYVERYGTSSTFYTDSTGTYKHSSTVPSESEYGGEWKIIASAIASAGQETCPYVSDEENFYIVITDECGDGFCDEDEKELICEGVCSMCPAPTQTTGATATTTCGCTTYCHVKCQNDCTPSCGNGVCDTVVCEALGCPIPENEQNCPSDCKEPTYCGSQSSDPNCICQQGYVQEDFEAPCLEVPVVSIPETYTAISATGFTQLGPPEEWELGNDGVFKLRLTNNLPAQAEIKSITAGFGGGYYSYTFNTYNCKGDGSYMTIEPGGYVDVHSYCTNLDYNIIYPGLATGSTYSVSLEILYNAGGYDHTDSGMLTGTVVIAERECTDSDDGLNYYVKGICRASNVVPEGSLDGCVSEGSTPTNKVREMYCTENNQCSFIDYECPNGCENGVCLQEAMCTYYRCVPSYNDLYLYTDKYAYDINEPVEIYTNNIEEGQLDFTEIEVSVKKPYGDYEMVTLTAACEIIDECPATCAAGYYCPPCVSYTTCRYKGTFTGTNAVGLYHVSKVSSSDEDWTIYPASFRVYDSSVLGNYLILENIDGYLYKESHFYPGPENVMSYIAIYEKDGRPYGVVVYDFETREDLEETLKQAMQYTPPSEEKVDGYHIYVFENYGQKVYAWTYKTFLIGIMENVPIPVSGYGVAKTVTAIEAPTQQVASETTIIETIEEVQESSDFLSGMVTGMPVAGSPPTVHCGMDSLYSQCICEGDEIKDEFTPPCAYSPCPTHYRCLLQYPEDLVKAYLGKYPSDLKAAGTECEDKGGYCIDIGSSCQFEFGDVDFACKTSNEKCCVKEVDRDDFLEMVMKLEGIRVLMDKLERQANVLADYYDSAGDDDRASKFSEVAGMFATARDMVDDIIAKIRSNLDNLDEIRSEVKGDIYDLRMYILSILEKIVS